MAESFLFTIRSVISTLRCHIALLEAWRAERFPGPIEGSSGRRDEVNVEEKSDDFSGDTGSNFYIMYYRLMLVH